MKLRSCTASVLGASIHSSSHLLQCVHGWSIRTETLDRQCPRSRNPLTKAFLTASAGRVQALVFNVPIHFSGGQPVPQYIQGLQSRVGVTYTVETGVCSLLGFGRNVAPAPDLLKAILDKHNPTIASHEVFAVFHIDKGQSSATITSIRVLDPGFAS
jgi:hypothetical protein